MLYAEAAYFDGAHVQHIADYHEHLRMKRIAEANRKAVQEWDRRRGSRRAMAA